MCSLAVETSDLNRLHFKFNLKVNEIKLPTLGKPQDFLNTELRNRPNISTYLRINTRNDYGLST